MNIKDLLKLYDALGQEALRRLRAGLIFASASGPVAGVCAWAVGIGAVPSVVIGAVVLLVAVAGVIRLESARRVERDSVLWSRICRRIDERAREFYGFGIQGSDLWLARHAENNIRIMEFRNDCGRLARAGLKWNEVDGELEIFDPQTWTSWPLLERSSSSGSLTLPQA